MKVRQRAWKFENTKEINLIILVESYHNNYNLKPVRFLLKFQNFIEQLKPLDHSSN